MGGQSLVFRGRPARFEPMAPPPARNLGKPPTPPKDFSDPTTFSMPPVTGVRDVNEVY